MGLFDRITGKAKRDEAIAKKEAQAAKRAEAKAKKQAETEAKKNDPKSQATAAGDPWVQVLSIDVDKDNPGQGAFELDWNDIFVARLIKSGYQGKTDQDIVDNWFKTICRNIIQENFEQEQADPEIRASNRRDLGNGRTEIS